MTLRTLSAAILFALAVTAAGCSGEHADHDAAPAAMHAEDTAPAAHATEAADHAAHAAHAAPAAHATPAALPLTLNDGAKWSMDEHTRASSAALQTHLSEAAPVVVEALTALGATLQGDINGLIKGCTMSGPSHDQLHVFLMAFLPEVQALSATTDVAAGRETVERLKGLMAAYGEHFE